MLGLLLDAVPPGAGVGGGGVKTGLVPGVTFDVADASATRANSESDRTQHVLY